MEGQEVEPETAESKENASPKPKRRKLSLSTNKGKKTTRFNFKTQEEIEDLSKGYIPPNTEKNTKWAKSVFTDWVAQRNLKFPDEQCPENILQNVNAEEIAKWFPIFIAEVRRCDGEQYPAKSIHQILAGLLRYMRGIDKNCPNFLDKNDHRFQGIDRTCESVYRSLRKQGVGADVRHTPVVTVAEETKLWDLNILNTTTPKGLLRAVFYYVGKVCCLRGGEEQRCLKKSQFTRHYNPDMYKYIETGSKNRSGGIAQLHLKNKIVPIYAVPENRPRCLVFLLDLYFSKFPPESSNIQDVFYLRPKVKPPGASDQPWFDAMPIGKNKLSSMMKEMSVEAGFEETKSNHSLRATGASALFASGLPEKLIQSTTGHRSVEALREYERSSIQQEVEKTRILTSLESSANVTVSGDDCNTTVSNCNDKAPSVPSFSGCSIGHITFNFNP